MNWSWSIYDLSPSKISTIISPIRWAKRRSISKMRLMEARVILSQPWSIRNSLSASNSMSARTSCLMMLKLFKETTGLNSALSHLRRSQWSRSNSNLPRNFTLIPYPAEKELILGQRIWSTWHCWLRRSLFNQPPWCRRWKRYSKNGAHIPYRPNWKNHLWNGNHNSAPWQMNAVFFPIWMWPMKKYLISSIAFSPSSTPFQKFVVVFFAQIFLHGKARSASAKLGGERWVKYVHELLQLDTRPKRKIPNHTHGTKRSSRLLVWKTLSSYPSSDRSSGGDELKRNRSSNRPFSDYPSKRAQSPSCNGQICRWGIWRCASRYSIPYHAHFMERNQPSRSIRDFRCSDPLGLYYHPSTAKCAFHSIHKPLTVSYLKNFETSILEIIFIPFFKKKPFITVKKLSFLIVRA